ncbi:hypothetical protein Tco_1230166 [Tanacetum coccineum]
MSSASSAVTYTSVYTDSEPGRVFWGADEEISDGGIPRSAYRGIILLILGGFAWYYTHAYIEDGVTFIATSSVTFLAKDLTSQQCKSHKVLEIASVAIIDRQLPFEYTITSRSTDVHCPRLPAADSQAQVLSQWNAVYDAYNESGEVRPNPTFHACKQEGVKLVAAITVLQMKGYVRPTGGLGYMLPQDLIVANGKEKDKQVYIRALKTLNPSTKEHQLRMTPAPLQGGIFTIELFSFPNKCWVYDTGCGTHICITKQGFREAKKLKQGAVYLYVGNGVRAITLHYPLGLCSESATRILNMVPTKKVDKTPYELWYGKVPNLSYLKVWGCEALVKRDTPDKL